MVEILDCYTSSHAQARHSFNRILRSEDARTIKKAPTFERAFVSLQTNSDACKQNRQRQSNETNSYIADQLFFNRGLVAFVDTSLQPPVMSSRYESLQRCFRSCLDRVKQGKSATQSSRRMALWPNLAVDHFLAQSYCCVYSFCFRCKQTIAIVGKTRKHLRIV